MSARTSRSDFEALVRRAGLTLSETETTELYGAWPLLEAMLDRLRNPDRGPEVEPAHVFKPRGA